MDQSPFTPVWTFGFKTAPTLKQLHDRGTPVMTQEQLDRSMKAAYDHGVVDGGYNFRQRAEKGEIPGVHVEKGYGGQG